MSCVILMTKNVSQPLEFISLRNAHVNLDMLYLILVRNAMIFSSETGFASSSTA